MTNGKSDFDLIRSTTHNCLRKWGLENVRVDVSQLPDEQTKIELWIPRVLVCEEWLGIADYFFGHFGGDNESGKFKHISMGGEQDGSYTWYIVAPKTDEKESAETPMLLERDMIF